MQACLKPLRRLSDVSSIRDASHMSAQRDMPLICYLNETYAGYLLVNLDFLGFGSFPWKSDSFTRNEAQKQHSLLDTIFYYIFHFGPPEKSL